VHLATGSEIVAPEQAPQRGQIRDSNSILVRAFLAHWQAELQQRRVAEDAAAIESAIRHPASAIESADMLLISGGASVGEHDFTRRLLEDSGFDILISKTSLRPGKPLIVARRGRTVAFGLPGNPLSHFVCLNLFVRAALDRVCGRTPPRFRRGRLAMKLESDGHVRETFWPSRCETDGETPGLSPLRWSSSGDLTALAAANALIRVPARSPDLPAGAEVEFLATLC
jgi:molybdopterin molybdotransferase